MPSLPVNKEALPHLWSNQIYLPVSYISNFIDLKQLIPISPSLTEPWVAEQALDTILQRFRCYPTVHSTYGVYNQGTTSNQSLETESPNTSSQEGSLSFSKSVHVQLPCKLKDTFKCHKVDWVLNNEKANTSGIYHIGSGPHATEGVVVPEPKCDLKQLWVNQLHENQQSQVSENPQWINSSCLSKLTLDSILSLPHDLSEIPKKNSQKGYTHVPMLAGMPNLIYFDILLISASEYPQETAD